MTGQTPNDRLLAAGIALLTNADRLAAMTAAEIRSYAVEILQDGAGAVDVRELVAHDRDPVTTSTYTTRDALAAAGYVDPQWLPTYRP